MVPTGSKNPKRIDHIREGWRGAEIAIVTRSSFGRGVPHEIATRHEPPYGPEMLNFNLLFRVAGQCMRNERQGMWRATPRPPALVSMKSSHNVNTRLHALLAFTIPRRCVRWPSRGFVYNCLGQIHRKCAVVSSDPSFERDRIVPVFGEAPADFLPPFLV